MLTQLAQDVEEACGLSSPTRRKKRKKKGRGARTYGPVRRKKKRSKRRRY